MGVGAPSCHYLVLCKKGTKKGKEYTKWSIWDSVKRDFAIDCVNKKELFQWAKTTYELTDALYQAYKTNMRKNMLAILSGNQKALKTVNSGIQFDYAELETRIVEDKVHAVVRKMNREQLESLLQQLSQ